MQLTLPERIQILRKRAGLNQAQLGSQAFKMSTDSGRTKIKNIELGKQTPTTQEIECIAHCLNAPLEQLTTSPSGLSDMLPTPNGVVVSRRVLDLFPELAQYLDMLDKAVEMKDAELVSYLAGRVATIMQNGAPGIRSETTQRSTRLG